MWQGVAYDEKRKANHARVHQKRRRPIEVAVPKRPPGNVKKNATRTASGWEWFEKERDFNLATTAFVPVAYVEPVPAIDSSTTRGKPPPTRRRLAAVTPNPPGVSGKLVSVFASLPTYTPPSRTVSRWIPLAPGYVPQALPRNDIYGNASEVDAVFSSVAQNEDLRDMRSVNILTGPCGVGKRTTILSACQQADRRCIHMAHSDFPSGYGDPAPFYRALQSIMQPPTASVAMITSIEGFSQEQEDLLFHYLQTQVMGRTCSHNRLWLVGGTTRSGLLDRLSREMEESQTPQAFNRIYMSVPSQQEMRRAAVAWGCDDERVDIAQGDLRKLAQLAGAEECVQASSADTISNPFYVVPRLFGGHTDGTVRVSKQSPAEFEALRSVVCGSVRDVVEVFQENYANVVDFPGMSSLAEGLSDVELLLRFEEGSSYSAGVHGQDIAAEYLCHLTQQRDVQRGVKPFRVGARRGRARQVRFATEEAKAERRRQASQYASLVRRSNLALWEDVGQFDLLQRMGITGKTNETLEETNIMTSAYTAEKALNACF